ncbi:MAG TPA: porin family protein [Bacteroidales bacterium]|nr:porin family protein [Bacteroidales bacterium]HPT22555.1 porin family protein [Bacteroidales bacterium]
MRIFKALPDRAVTISLALIFVIFSRGVSNAQPRIGFGVHIDPAVCWFTSDIKKVSNEGSRPGFNFGLTFNRYFTENYSFSTGLSLIQAGGRLVGQDTAHLDFTSSPVNPGIPVVYKIKYLAFPVGLKLQTNQIGYFTYFTDLGIDPKIVVGGKADVKPLGISDENARNELRMFNLSYHITAGAEYSLGGTTALVLGLSFENNFMDVTKDIGDQPGDIISHKILSIRMGVNF